MVLKNFFDISFYKLTYLKTKKRLEKCIVKGIKILLRKKMGIWS